MIINIAILMLSIPAGYLIAWLARDELIMGRIWFKVLIIMSMLIGIIFYFFDRIYISLSAAFIVIVSAISLMKSYDKKWIKKV